MSEQVEVIIDGAVHAVPAGVTVVAALALAGRLCTRRSVGGEARFALCGMGHCQECRVTIDGRAHQLACQVRCAAGMAITTGMVASE